MSALPMPPLPPPLPIRAPARAMVTVSVSREDLAALQPLLARFETFSRNAISEEAEALVWRLKVAVQSAAKE